jgi:ribonucleotide monophosphatase NagD (HAD superfamily)
MTLAVSSLPKTWLIDIDGTIFQHNGYLTGQDEVLPGVVQFLSALPPEDVVILMTARSQDHRNVTVAALDRHGIRYDQVLFALPVGERILINDRKPSGLATAFAINLDRNVGLGSVIDMVQVSDI